MRNSRLSLLIAGMTLFIVLGGSAVAASGLINGKKIKPGTISAKQIRNKTITQGKLAPSTVSSLRGQTGAPGPTGKTGATGATGAAGDDGIVAPLTGDGATVNLNSPDTMFEATHVALEPGTYMVTARASVNSQATNNTIGCALVVDNVDDFDIVDNVSEGPVGLNRAINLSLLAVAQAGDKITVVCSSDQGAAQVSSSRIIAIPAG